MNNASITFKSEAEMEMILAGIEPNGPFFDGFYGDLYQLAESTLPPQLARDSFESAFNKLLERTGGTLQRKVISAKELWWQAMIVSEPQPEILKEEDFQTC